MEDSQRLHLQLRKKNCLIKLVIKAQRRPFLIPDKNNKFHEKKGRCQLEKIEKYVNNL